MHVAVTMRLFVVVVVVVVVGVCCCLLLWCCCKSSVPRPLHSSCSIIVCLHISALPLCFCLCPLFSSFLDFFLVLLAPFQAFSSHHSFLLSFVFFLSFSPLL